MLLHCRLLAHPMSSGLRKALKQECNDLYSDCIHRIKNDPLSAPERTLEWRKGSFSFVYVRAVEVWANVFFHDLENMVMAQGKKKNGQKKPLADYTFVRCELTSEDKKAAKIWIEENMGDLGAIIHDIVASDYKMSVSFSQDHDTFTASLTGKEGALNEYKTLTARHADWTIAVMTVAYKHSVMFGSKVWESEDSEDDGWA